MEGVHSGVRAQYDRLKSCWHRHPRFHQGPLLCSMVVGKSREGVPTWDGDPSTWTTYRTSALLFVESTKWENRYVCGPRLASELTGPAKASIASKKPTWLSHENGVARLLKHLQERREYPRDSRLQPTC